MCTHVGDSSISQLFRLLTLSFFLSALLCFVRRTLETRLAITETTNDVANATVYDSVDTASLPTWVRVQIANRLAKGG